MKKSTKAQTVISLILIFAVLTLGVLAYLMTQKDISSKMRIVISDKNVLVNLHGEAQWASNSDVNKTFETNTSSSGFDNDTWSLPNVVWNDVNKNQTAVLKLTITNTNINNTHKLKFVISGLKYDAYDRFITEASYDVGNGEENVQTISESYKTYYFMVPCSIETVTIYVKYSLQKENTHFKFGQDIDINITQELISG